MLTGLNFFLGKTIGQLSKKVLKYGKTNGGSYPGFLFLKFASYDGLIKLSKNLSLGSILVTGTNGKTTTTKILTNLLEKDMEITKSFENNTIFALTTSLLNPKGNLGVFEYGIRDIKHGIPDIVQKYLNPIGVVYTNVSREHVQVAGVKNSFEDYLLAKSLLSKNMHNGVIITNSDDPRVSQIALANLNINSGANGNKNINEYEESEYGFVYKNSSDLYINFYGLDLDNLDFGFVDDLVKCPVCGEPLNYKKRYMNQRGIYSCSCGFSRPEPNLKIDVLKFIGEKMEVHIIGFVYNYTLKKCINLDITIYLPLFGLHNVYNVLAAVTTYLTFTSKKENIEFTIKSVCNNLTLSFLPPGRFEIIDFKGKKLGLGQGDNGDAFNANVYFMKQIIGDNEFEFIYTTPDEMEEEIFEDHMKVIRDINPNRLIFIPGRESVDVAKDYYAQVKDEFGADFSPFDNEDLDARVEKLAKLAINSNYKYIIMTGCGEEQKMWGKIKDICKSN